MRTLLSRAMAVVVFAVFSITDACSGEVMVRCPLDWPESGTPRATARKANVWMYAVSDLRPVDDNTYPVKMTKPDGISIDCRYSNGRRLTVVVPGITRHCEAEYVPGGEHLNPKAVGAVCFTHPDVDGTMGPIRTYIVEPVTLKTRIDGLGLGMSRAEILDIAQARGYQVIDGESNPIRLKLGTEDVTVEFAKTSDLSKDVAFWYEPRKGTRYRETAYRFGLDRDISSKKYPDGQSRDSLWRSITDSSEIEILREPNDKRLTIHLRDRNAE